jgi:hypothetical protein
MTSAVEDGKTLFFMKIKKICVGGWFQRTMLQLTEIYDFLLEGTSNLDLDKNKLLKLRDSLDIKSVDYHSGDLDYIKINTTTDISFKMYEDGLIVLSDSDVAVGKLNKELDMVANYYEKKLSPALHYLFSTGAPIPKQLANIKTIYPYFIIMEDATEKQIIDLINKTDDKDKKYHQFNNKDYDIYRVKKYHFINAKNRSVAQIERYVEEQTFIREFKGQLHRYLNLHRTIWAKIEEIKSNTKVKGKDIIKYNSKIDSYAKTINLISSRINQMDSYLSTREKIAKNDKNLHEFLGIMGYRYENLGNTLSYIKQIWIMTENYVKSAKALFDGLEEKVTKRSIDKLSVIVFIGVAGQMMRLMSAPEITPLGITYLVAFGTAGYIASKLVSYFSKYSSYKVSDTEYAKNIK